MSKVPRSNFEQNKKAFKRIILDNVKETQEQVISIRKDMKKLIQVEVEKKLGDKVHMIESALRGVMVQRKIFEDKGYITKEDINKKYEELKKERNG